MYICQLSGVSKASNGVATESYVSQIYQNNELAVLIKNTGSNRGGRQ